MELCSTRQASEVLEIPYRTVDQLVRDGIIKPAVEAGPHTQRQFAVTPDLLAIATGRGMRASGYAFKLAGDAMERLMNLSEMDFALAFSEGRHYLMIVGNEVSDGLVTKSRVLKAARINRPLQERLGLLPTGIDVHRVYRNILRILSETGKSGTEARKSRPAVACAMAAGVPGDGGVVPAC